MNLNSRTHYGISGRCVGILLMSRQIDLSGHQKDADTPGQPWPESAINT